MKGRSHRHKYHRKPVAFERDASILLTMVLEEFPSRVICDAINDARFREVYDLAIRDGLPEAEARALGEEAKITLRTFYNLKDKLLNRAMRPANEAVGREILEKQLATLEEARLKLRHAEARCWREFNKGSQSEVIDITPGAEPSTTSEADPRWIERIESLIWKQLQVTEKQTAIRGALSVSQSGPVATLELAGSGDEAAAKSLKLWEIQTLYREDAFAMGLGATEARTRMQTIQAFVEGKAPRGGEGGGGGEGRVTFRVVGLEVEEGGE